MYKGMKIYIVSNHIKKEGQPNSILDEILNALEEKKVKPNKRAANIISEDIKESAISSKYLTVEQIQKLDIDEISTLIETLSAKLKEKEAEDKSQEVREVYLINDKLEIFKSDINEDNDLKGAYEYAKSNSIAVVTEDELKGIDINTLSIFDKMDLYRNFIGDGEKLLDYLYSLVPSDILKNMVDKKNTKIMIDLSRVKLDIPITTINELSPKLLCDIGKQYSESISIFLPELVIVNFDHLEIGELYRTRNRIGMGTIVKFIGEKANYDYYRMNICEDPKVHITYGAELSIIKALKSHKLEIFKTYNESDASIGFSIVSCDK